MARSNNRRDLNFSNAVVAAELIEGASSFALHGRNIVFNIGDTVVEIAGKPRQRIQPFSSTTLIDAVIENAQAMIVIRVRETEGARASTLGWPRYAETITDPTAEILGLPLYRSSQDDLTEIRLSGAAAMLAGNPETEGMTFAAKANLWFAPEATDCLIHNLHPFVETHVQIMGVGRMQKFQTQQRETLTEEILMAPGFAQPFFDCTSDSIGGFLYPWHQYYADTDCIWLALELHPLAGSHD